MLDRDLGPHEEARLYDSILAEQPTVDVLISEDWIRIRDLVITYADLHLGGTDAGLIALAERHRQRRIATLNRRHFGVVRPAHVDAFTLLPDGLS